MLYLIYAIIGTLYAKWHGLSGSELRWTPFYIVVALPFFAMSALKFGEAGMDVFKCVCAMALLVYGLMAGLCNRSLRPLFLSLLPGSQKRLQDLKQTREQLSNELSELISESAALRMSPLSG